ncbi:longitudinals lacking protein, isoforms A/B/D/L-like [Homalodisca vitripennis]|uniref:longitudinals lacking protein, isoforms A/B/D/L-like n=1 Tax=Homalodisca vitripennis TaxID=197043 RepID=UPI001EEC67C1|nr:longitudinals lacking protein, isoforms A/B/D/L-like [Homalodisca vitripennis]
MFLTVKMFLHSWHAGATDFSTSRLSVGMEFATILQPDGSSQYQCNVCHHVFRKKGSLAEHQRFICGQDPQFGCPHCPYKTKLKSNLKKHM